MSSIDLLATCWTTAGDAVALPGRDASPIPLPERVHAAARAGFTGFGVAHNDLANYLGTADLATLADILADAGMSYVELEFLTDWWHGDSPARSESDGTLRLLLDAAEVLTPHHVKIGPDIHGGAYDLDQWAEQFHRVCTVFAQVGTKVAIEFMPFSNLSTLAAGAELVSRAGHPSGGLMIDLWHLARGGGTLTELAALSPTLISAVELDDGDAVQVGGGYSDTILRRRLCGQGSFPVAEAIQTLRGLGWDGPWGVEILSEVYRLRPLAEALADVYATTMACFAEADRLGPGAPSHVTTQLKEHNQPC